MGLVSKWRFEKGDRKSDSWSTESEYVSDLVVVDKKRTTCKIIDFAVPGDSRIEKQKEKVEKYQDLRRDLQKIWNVWVKIIPLVVGSLAAVPKKFDNRL